GSRGGACAPTSSCGCVLPRFSLAVSRRAGGSFLALLLPFLGAFLGALAVARVALDLHHLGPGLEGAHLAQAAHHLDALPDAHPGHLPHHRADHVELVEELLDLVVLDAAAGRDPPPPAEVYDIRIAPLGLRHPVDHALDALDPLLGVLA